MRTSEVLNKAADLIEERGWAQGPDSWHTAHGSLCIEGGIMAALDTVVRDFDFTCPVYMAVCSHLGRFPLPPTAPIRDALWQWNDDPARSASEVIEVLRACAVIEAAREDQDAAEATYAENLAVSA